MIGFKLFRHSVRQIFGNLDDVLRITAFPWIAICLTSYLLGLEEAMARYFIVLNTYGEAQFPFTQTLVYACVSLLGGIWIAVAWHRFVLLGERPEGFLPSLHGWRMMDYAGMLVVTFLLAIPIGFGIGVCVALARSVGRLLAPDFSVVIVVPVAIVAVLASISWAMRLSACLPGVAVGHSAVLTRTWRATRGHNLEIFTATFLAIVFLTVLQLPVAWLTPLSDAHYISQAVLGWISMVIVLSLLTTMYGYYVEERALT